MNIGCTRVGLSDLRARSRHCSPETMTFRKDLGTLGFISRWLQTIWPSQVDEI